MSAPQATEADALDDRSWFANHPNRRFRARVGDGGRWLIRRRAQGAAADVLLRTFSRTTERLSRDGDSELAALWYMAAYPDWPPKKAQKAARKSLGTPRS
jgi:hypothetical protein